MNAKGTQSADGQRCTTFMTTMPECNGVQLTVTHPRRQVPRNPRGGLTILGFSVLVSTSIG